MTEARALRVLLVANDGRSAGHVTRMLAIASALARVARARGVALRSVLATTSQAHALLLGSLAVVVQLPAPGVARRAGFTDLERRRLVNGTLDGIARSLAPDLVVVDTFALGPHDELVGIDFGYARRALVRRHVPAEAVLTRGVELYDLAILADDPGAFESALPCRLVRVPPITTGGGSRSKAEARAALGLPAEGRILLVAAGGGGDETATKHATLLARAIARLDPSSIVALALGPLAPTGADEIRRVHVAPIAPFLAAFDGAFAPAGYNTAHELAIARVPTALFAEERPFDDQAARAARFEAAGHATFLRALDDDTVARALGSLKAPRMAITPGGADRAAEALLDLATAAA